MNCPRCAKPMQVQLLDGHLGREVEVDLCVPCQSLWFDMREARAATRSSAARRTCSARPASKRAK